MTTQLRKHRGSALFQRLAATAIALCAVSAAAAAGGRPASFVIDANTGTVISAYNADEPRYPASLTKMMTLYVTFDLMQQGRLNENTRIKISANAAAAQPTKLSLEPDADIALIDAIKALVTLSANDIAIAIAEHIAGSEDRFAALMTQKARALGMKGTTFKNASGLPNSEQVTTARDMVTLGLRLHDDFPKYYTLFAMRDFRYAGRTHLNHNTMLNNYEGTEGIKTGYTQASGFNLVSSVKRGSKHVVGAVFGGVTASSRNATMRTLLNMALYKASATKTRVPAVLLARTRSVPEPKLEARTTRDYAANAKPSIVPSATPSARLEPVPVSLSAAAQPNNPATGRVEIARVRPVLVAPREPRQAPVGFATLPATPEPAKTASLPQPIRIASASHSATAPTDFKLPPLASSAISEQPSPRASVALQRAATPTPLAVGYTPAVTATAPGSARGNAPSSFQQQAANLGAAPPPDVRSQTTAARPPATPASSVEIQIGAYATAAEAERQLGIARSKASDLIGSAQAKAQPVNANGKSLWRARFAGFQASTAGTVCTELRRRQIDCLVTKAE